MASDYFKLVLDIMSVRANQTNISWSFCSLAVLYKISSMPTYQYNLISDPHTIA